MEKSCEIIWIRQGFTEGNDNDENYQNGDLEIKKIFDGADQIDIDPNLPEMV